MPTISPTAWRALGLDVASVLLFVAVGRRSHDEGGNAIAGMFEVAAPFLIALGVAWLVTQAWKHPDHLRTGIAIWALTVIDGMLLRRFVFGRGTAASFVVVTAIVTAVLLIGWRAVLAWRARRVGARAAG